MSSEPDSLSRDDPRLNEIIAQYLLAVEAGESPDPEQLLREHPEYAEELRQFLADKRQVDAIAGAVNEDSGSPQAPVQNPLDVPTLPPENTAVDAPTLAPSAAANKLPKPGTVLRYFGDYELLAEIARGGMGVVYKARQVKLNRVVAIKMILAGQLASQEDVQRFYTEAEAAAGLDHAGIVPIYEVGEHEGQHYFSMGFVDGDSLSGKIADQPLAPRDVASLLHKISEAVQYAHDQGVIHRDLKPANVLLDRNEEPKITDFGLAKQIETESGMTASGQILGTPSYMPPEQAAGRLNEVRETADVYSLGAILYAVLTGRPPFQADNPLDTLMQVLEREPISPRQLNPNIPRDLETICLKCLEKDRRRRYQSAQELGDELQRFQEGRPIEARPASPIERAAKWARRKPAIAALATVSIAGAAALLIVLTVSNFLIRTEQAKTESALSKRTQALKERSDAFEALEEEQTRTQTALDREIRATYSQRLAIAQAELQLNAHGRFEDLLEQCPAELRDWGWHFLKRSADGSELLTLDHTKASSVAFHPDGRRFASGGWDGLIRLWDLQTGEQLQIVGDSAVGAGSGLDRLTFSPDGKWFAAARVNRRVHIFSAETMEEAVILRGHSDRILGLEFSPDGRRLATGSDDGTAKIWDTATANVLLTISGHTDKVRSVSFHPDATRLATCSWDQSVRIWHVPETARGSLSTPEATLALTQTGIEAAYSPDGKQIAAADSDKVVTAWNAETGEVQFRFVEEFINSLGYSPDGTRLVTTSYAAVVRFWDTTSGQEMFSIREVLPSVIGVAFSPDGWRMATPAGNAVKLWSAAPLTNDDKELRLQGHTRTIRSLAFSPNGNRLVTASEDRTLRVWDVDSRSDTIGSVLRTLKGHTAAVYATAVSPDGSRVVSGGEDRSLRIWDVATGTEIHSIRGLPDIVNGVEWSDDGSYIVTSESYSPPRLWDAATYSPIRAFGVRQGGIHGVALSPKSKRVALARFDGLVQVYDAESAEKLLELRGEEGEVRIICVPAFSRDSKWLAASTSLSGAVTVWDVTSGERVHTLQSKSPGLTSLYGPVAFSPDSRYLAAAGYRGTATVWDLESGERAYELRGPLGTTWAIAFSPDGHRLALGGGHRTKGEVRIWDLRRVKIKTRAQGTQPSDQVYSEQPGPRSWTTVEDAESYNLWPSRIQEG